jgi:peptidoglycan/LPS O-acetylase OafA/YrhL
MKMEKGKKLTYGVAIIAAIVAIIVFCIIAVVFDVMPLDVLPANFLGATLGALIGALITLVLLRGQTDIVEKKIRT